MNRMHASLRTLPAVLLLSLAAFVPAQSAPSPSPAAPVDFRLEPTTTAIHWVLNTTVHTVHGTFKLQKGLVHIVPSTGEASGLIVIDAASGDSGDSARDRRMDNVVLESARFPAITFRPTHVNGKVDLSTPGPILIDGVMNIHGVDHPMQLSATLQPKNSGVASKIHFEVPYVAWGMKDPSLMMFRCDKTVSIDIDTTAVATENIARMQ